MTAGTLADACAGLRLLRVLSSSVFVLAAAGCGPNVESDPEVRNDHESLCAGGLPAPVELHLPSETLTFRSGTVDNGLVFSSAADTCRELLVGPVDDEQLFLNIYFWPFERPFGRPRESIHAGGMPPPPTAYLANMPTEGQTFYTTEYSVGGWLEVDHVVLGLTAEKVGRVRGSFEVEFADAPPISSSFDVTGCKPVCYD